MSNAFATLSRLFRYPDGPIDCLNVDVPDVARGSVEAFAREVSALDRDQLESAYTSTFDLAPSCSPYVGAHLFGEDDRDRGRLLAGLRMTYEKTGLRFDERELPDHIAEVLAFAEHEEAEEWPELVKLILVPALTKMDAVLRSSTNPYRHLVAAARQASEAALIRGES
jgi:nitrate reductase delta subunit